MHRRAQSKTDSSDSLDNKEAASLSMNNHASPKGTFLTRRTLTIGGIAILAATVIAVSVAVPLASKNKSQQSSTEKYNVGATNASAQAPTTPSNLVLIDKDTPKDAYTYLSIDDGSEWDLVFSDEFNKEGRTFAHGDDPVWEAADLHNRATGDLQWYSPDMVTTSGGSLQISLVKQKWKGLDYKGGMLTSWNKFCFTGGYFVANVSLPGASNIYGLWPAIWTMGNLGRAGYGASLDGTWPYTYDSCDVGTLRNQTLNGKPTSATSLGDPSANGALSYQSGQRLSACTCAGEAHPGPKRADGSFVGRSAPEIDMFEGMVNPSTLIGHVTQNGQWAPFNYAYEWKNTSDTVKIFDKKTVANLYAGGVYQQMTGTVSPTNQDCYTQGKGCFSVYGFEYKPGTDGYITWVNDGHPSWSLRGAAMGADPRVEIGARPVSQEPMYMILNLAMSPNFGVIDFQNLMFPSVMSVDWVRVYQPKGQQNVGCDPPDFPTAEYIKTHMEAYTNSNLTTWAGDYKQPVPKNRLVDTCA